MRQIIGIDSWTGGVSHYARLVPAFRDAGFSLKLIHFGSIGHDANRSLSEVIDGLDVYDISFYADQHILSVLRTESPAAVVFLSTEAFLHRAVIRYCRVLGIPTIHLYHGLISVQAVEGGNPDRYSRAALIKLLVARACKNICRILPIYLESMVRTGVSFSDIVRLAGDVFTKVTGGYNTVAAPDATTTACLVYAESDIDHAHTKYRIPKEAIGVVGNPDLIRFNVCESDHLCAIGNRRGRDIVYIDHGGSTCGLNFSSDDEFVVFVQSMSRALEAQGFVLKVKLHPSQNATSVPDRISLAGVKLSTNETFVSDLKSCAATIVGPSTASMIPAFLGVPVFLARFDQFRGQEYGRTLLRYPRVCILNDLHQVSRELHKLYRDDRRAQCAQWIKMNIGPLPAELMPVRVVQSIRRIINDIS